MNPKLVVKTTLQPSLTSLSIVGIAWASGTLSTNFVSKPGIAFSVSKRASLCAYVQPMSPTGPTYTKQDLGTLV